MSKEISGIELSINKLPNAYGIRQSSWNNIRNKFSFGGFEKERSLTDYIKTRTTGTYMSNIYEKKYGFWGQPKSVKTGEYMASNWNLSSIGSFSIKKGFFSEEPYIVCSNCYKGKVSGKITADIVEIIIVKESSNPSNPNRNEILEKNYSLWSIRIDVKCNTCDKHTQWGGVQESNISWGCAEHSNFFSKIA